MQLEQQLDQLREIEQDLRILLSSPGWIRVKSLIQQQSYLRRQQRDAVKLTSLDSCFQMASLIGEADGMKLVELLAEDWLRQVEEEIQTVLNAMEAEKDMGKE